MRLGAVISAVALSVSCASAPAIRQADLSRLGEADREVLAGCYACLFRARSIYESLAVPRARPLLVTRLFTTQLLIALRQHEMAVDASDAADRARRLVPELPATVDGQRLMRLVDNLPGSEPGWPRVELTEFRRAHLEVARGVNAEIQWLMTGPVDIPGPIRQYLALSIDCSYRPRASDPSLIHWKPAADAPTLVRYRAATCEPIDWPGLTQIRSEIPEYVETSYLLSRPAVNGLVGGGGDGREAFALLDEARATFPESIVVALLTATARQLVGDCERGLGLYDRVIAVKGRHEDAWLGRTTCLTALGRHEDAITAASQMVELQPDNIDLAWYWRAWNRHHLGRLAEARADIESARARRRNVSVFTLAGIIEHDQDDLTPAERDLKTAVGLEWGACVAHWYLGSLYTKQTRAKDAAPSFATAMTCYQAAADELSKTLAALESNEAVDPEFKRRRVAVLRASMLENRKSQHAAAYNAANSLAIAGDVARAATMLEFAAGDPSIAEAVEDLRGYLARVKPPDR